MSATAPARTGVVLRVHNLHAAYGPITALRGVEFEVREGSCVTLLGANGAGKSTTLRVISALQPATEGFVEYQGRNIEGLPPGDLVRHGLMHVPEGRQIFGELTIEENLKIGAFTQPWTANLRKKIDDVYELFPVLRERRKQAAALMSGGEQQMLAIGRALMADPKVLLLDEPSLGLAPLMVRDIYRVIRTLNKERGVTTLLVEQNATMALDVADYAYVLETGRIAVSGTAEQMRGNEDVRRAYLGY